MTVQPTEKISAVPFVLLGVLGVGGAAALGWIAYSRFFINHRYPLFSALEAERRTFVSHTAGVLSYYRSLPKERGQSSAAGADPQRERGCLCLRDASDL
jgi:hypothetical protein